METTRIIANTEPYLMKPPPYYLMTDVGMYGWPMHEMWVMADALIVDELMDDVCMYVCMYVRRAIVI